MRLVVVRLLQTKPYMIGVLPLLALHAQLGCIQMFGVTV